MIKKIKSMAGVPKKAISFFPVALLLATSLVAAHGDDDHHAQGTNVKLNLGMQKTQATSKNIMVGKADRVFQNGKIYTVDEKRSWAQAVAIKDGKFLKVGDDSDMAALIGPNTEVTDLQGKLTLPGFHDVHVHLISGYHFKEEGCTLPGFFKSTVPLVPEDVLSTLRDCLKDSAHNDDSWIVGQGFTISTFADEDPLYMLQQLDKITGDRPAYLVDESVHVAWVNSKAMEITGITPDVKEPQFGTIGRDPDTGKLTGVFTDYSAMELVGRHLPRLPLSKRVELARDAIAKFNANGITSMIEAGSTEADLAALNRLANDDNLNARIMTKIIAVRSGSTDETVPKAKDLLKLAKQYQAPGLNTKGAKIWLDGVGDNDSVAVEGIHFDHPWLYGNLTVSPEKLNKVMVDLDKNGLQTKIHTLGDKAVRVALDAIEVARDTNGMNDLRHHLAHSPMIGEKDFPRYKQLNVGVDFQPNMATELVNDTITSIVLWVMGMDHLNHMAQWKTLLDSGATMAVGSDWPVGDINPFIPMYLGATRDGLLDPEEDVNHPEQRLSMEELIPMYTINGAYLMQQEDKTGSIEEGKLADMIVMDRNIMLTPAKELLKAKVVLTILNGKPVYHAEESPMLTAHKDKSHSIGLH